MPSVVGARALLAALLLLLPVVGCAIAVDPDEARLCRTVLPALNGPGRIAVVRTEMGAEHGTVRIAYRFTPEGAATGRSRVALCRFAPDPAAGDATALVGLATEAGPMSGANLYLLKRYYLDTPEAIRAEPLPEETRTDLPEWPRPLAVGAEALLNGLPVLAVDGLLATAFALVWGLVGRINLAGGVLASAGAAAAGLAFAALATSGTTGLAAAAALVAGVASATAYGLVAGWLGFACVPARRGQASLIATVGVALALAEGLRLAAGPSPRWIPPVWTRAVPLAASGDFTVAVSASSLATAAIGFGAALALAWMMRASPFGRGWRAASQDGLAAALFGVDRSRLLAQTLALAGAAAGLAGVLVALRYGALGFHDGFGLGLKALAGAVLGGIGSVPGALAGGVAIGLVETLWSAALPGDGRDMALHALLVLAVVAFPDGIGRGRSGAPGTAP